MTSAEYARLKDLFFGALERPAEERTAFLEAACEGDADLRRRLLALLEAAREGDGFLEVPPVLPAEPAGGLVEGERLGPWEIVREIGGGGMGAVYEARRAEGDFARRAALKVVRPEIATDFFLRRFRMERRILAGLDHPHIARLLDAGATAAGLPFVVLELVEGRPLLEDCAARGLDVPDRLRLFLQICAAVEYAHRNLVVHRDLKPGNILVTSEGIPKLLDFGIAKLLEPETGAGPEGTATLLRLMTPEYASPEQLRGGSITTATDIYSLGVVLYELLTARKPYRFGSSEPHEVVRIVAEHEPSRPSVRVTQDEQGSAGLPGGAAPGKLARRLRGDLDTIVLTAMRKEPERRYPSVRQLSEDVVRYLEGRPILARKDTFSYRAIKFVRRHRSGVAAAALATAALVTGLVVTVLAKRAADFERGRAERRFNDVRRLANSFLFEIHDQIKDLPGSTPARQLLVRRALEYLDGLAKERGDDASLVRELAAAYQKVGDVQGNPYQPNLGDLPGALTSYRRAIVLLASLTDGPGAVAEDRSALAGTYLAGCGIPLVLGDTSAAVEMSGKGLALRQALLQESPKDARRKRDLSTALRIHAFNLSIARRHSEAGDALRQQAAILRELLAQAPEEAQLRGDLGQNRYVTGIALIEAGDRAAALAALLEAEDLQRNLTVAHPNNGAMRRNLFWSLTDAANLFLESDEPGLSRERYQEALEIAQSLSRADPTSRDGQALVAVAHVNLGELNGRLGRPGTARRHRTDARAVLETLVKAEPSNTWVAGILADLYVALAGDRAGSVSGGRSLESSCDLYRQGLALFERLKTAGRLPPAKEPAMQKARDRLKSCPEERSRASLR